MALKLETSLGIKGTLLVHGEGGKILKTIELNGKIPLSHLGLTVEQAELLIQKQKEAENGSDDCK